MGHISLEQIHRFPVKGFPGQTLEATNLETGRGIEHDRRFAITNGVESDGGWMQPRSYYINSTTDGMLLFKLDLDDAKGLLLLENKSGNRMSIQLGDQNSLEAANSNMALFMEAVGVSPDLPPPRIIEHSGPVANWDYRDTPLSIINFETIRAIEKQIGSKLDPRRFRGNLLVSGLPAWKEFSMIGKTIRIGETELEVTRPIDRCPAPGVNPETGERDVPVAELLVEHFGHVFCGMYAKVVRSGRVKISDPIKVVENANPHATAGNSEELGDFRQWPRPAVVSEYVRQADKTKLGIRSACSLKLPMAQPGQRVRFHLGSHGWTADHVTAHTQDQYSFEIEESQTSDPVTEYLRTGLETGREIIVSGPFGRVKAG